MDNNNPQCNESENIISANYGIRDNNDSKPLHKPRLEWLDAMRGFTMILVVAYHVAQMGFMEPAKQSSSMPFLMLFRMPLFFMVSGFLAYKASLTWNLDTLVSIIGKKMRIQLIPTAVFFLLACTVLYPRFRPAMETCLQSPMKGGYWFTLVLLYMFVIYYLFCFLESLLGRKSWIPITLFFLLSLVAYETCYLPKYCWWADGFKGKEPSRWLDYTSVIQLMKFFPFFLFGNIVRRYWDKAQRVMDSAWFFPSIVVVVTFCTLDVLKWHTLRMAWANVPSTMAKFCLPCIVFMYFRHYAAYMTQGTVIGGTLQYIGRRTLDIYLLHFLFLPNLPAVGAFFKTNLHNFLMDTTLSVIIAMLVIVFCIITSNILRISPFFRKYLFGRS
ncbi:MAG: acyltransferase [Bacteroides sp.]|nr:acyltransferase [Bacteroides sp.]MCM1447591.1 acyltransferase [Bacteroides sp.]